MAHSVPFRLNRSGLLLALVSATFAGQAGAAAGRVEFAIGGATVVGTDGRARPVSRGSELDSGDTVRTNEGRVQVRMTDGAFVSLQPNTEFGIKDYKFSGRADGTENALYSLVKGAMRTVTGLIGRVNRNRYQVATPTATVGIRGTGGLIQVLNDGATLVQGTSGIWFLANPSGSIDIPAGVAGRAPADPNQPPQETTDVPTSGPAPLPPLAEFSQGDQRTDSGANVLTAGVLVSGDGYTAAFAYAANFDGVFPSLDLRNGSASFNGAGQLIEFTTTNGTYKLDPSNGSNVDFGTDGILAWGRWVGTVSSIPNLFGSENYSSNQGLHYVVGLPTPSMPTTGSATYTLLGATRPTYLDGSTAPGTFSGSLSVDFGALTVGMNLNVTMPDASYTIGGAAPISGSTFSGSADPFGGGSLTVSGTNCSCSCSAAVDGFFAGSSAERAGLGYHVRNTFGTTKDILGAAAFQKP